MMNCHLASIIITHSTINPTTKSVLCLIKSEILNIATFNTTLKQEIAPPLTTYASSTYTYTRNIWVGPDPPHVHSALPESSKEKKKAQRKNKPVTVSPSPTKNTKITPTLTPNGKTSVSKDFRDVWALTPLHIEFYTPTEAITYLSKSVKGMWNNEKITNMIKMKYVPIGKSSMYNVWMTFKETTFTPYEWCKIT